MRLLFSITYYTPYSSGLTLYVKRLAERLGRKNIDCTVMCMQHQKNLSLQENINGVKIVRAKPLLSISKGFISLDWIIKSLKFTLSSDVIFLNLPQFEAIFPAIFGKLFQKKVISIYHCEPVLPEGVMNKIIQGVLYLSNLLSLLLSDRVITYTKDFAESSKLLSYVRNKVKTQYPPIVEPKIDKRVQNIIREKIGKKADFIIGVAARLAAEKGIEYLLEAIPLLEEKIKTPAFAEASAGRQNSKLKIIIAGSMKPVGEEHYKQKILRLVEQNKEYVAFLGELSEEEMGSFYSLLDVLVLPSVNSTEAFGMVQVEAMMTGVPVVATDLPGVRVPVQKTGMGKIVPIKNSRKLAEAIIEVLSNTEKFTRNAEIAKKEFSIDRCLTFYIKSVIKNLSS